MIEPSNESHNQKPKRQRMTDPNEPAPETDAQFGPDEETTEPTRKADPQAETDWDQANEPPQEMGATEREMLRREPLINEQNPEAVVDDDGERPPSELYHGSPTGDDTSVVGPDEIGAGSGLDEAELGRVEPLDKESWDGDPDEPLSGDHPADSRYRH